MIVHILPLAELELLATASWYERKQKGMGYRFLRRFEEFREDIESNPQVFQSVARPEKGYDVRVGQMFKFPYLVHYLVNPASVVVLSVRHAHSKRFYWRQRL